MRRLFFYSVISILLIALSTTVLRFLAIGAIIPDILLVWIVYLAVREGQLTATVAGFAIGLCLDLLSGQDGMLGLSALAKTLGGFTAGYFHNENKTVQILGSYRFIIAVAVSALVHHCIYFLIFLQGSDVSWWSMILLYGIPAALYTTAFGLLPMFAFARKYLT